MRNLPEERVGNYLREQGLSLAVAESCTGGLLGHRITNVAGSSDYYLGSVTAYAYEAKVRLLGVRWSTLETYGAVSGQTVAEMAEGIRGALAADFGIAISGIAGPGGGTPEKPVGLVYFGVSRLGQVSTSHRVFGGDRIAVKEQAAEEALQLLLQSLVGERDDTG